MSQRSKKRRRKPAQRARIQPPEGSAAERAASAAVPSMRAKLDEAPPPPWAPFPLTELVILLGILSAAVGWLAVSGPRQTAMVIGGFILISLASAELALREHLAGYRSHTLLLSSMPSIFVAGICWMLWHEYDLIPRQVAPIAFLGTFGFAVWQLRELFKRRSGGISFRV